MLPESVFGCCQISYVVAHNQAKKKEKGERKFNFPKKTKNIPKITNEFFFVALEFCVVCETRRGDLTFGLNLMLMSFSASFSRAHICGISHFPTLLLSFEVSVQFRVRVTQFTSLLYIFLFFFSVFFSPCYFYLRGFLAIGGLGIAI